MSSIEPERLLALAGGLAVAAVLARFTAEFDARTFLPGAAAPAGVSLGYGATSAASALPVRYASLATR